MQFTEVGASRTYPKYTQAEAGDVLVNGGVFVKTFEGKFGAQHLFRMPDESEIVLGKAGQLDYKLDEYVAPGDVVTVIFEGKEKLTKGAYAGKDVNCFKVLKGKVEEVAPTQGELDLPTETASLKDLE